MGPENIPSGIFFAAPQQIALVSSKKCTEYLALFSGHSQIKGILG